jgi:hypothetical protein
MVKKAILAAAIVCRKRLAGAAVFEALPPLPTLC